MSIVEAVLFDFDSRIRWFTREGVQNMSADILSAIRLKNYDRLEKYIACAKKHDFFDSAYNSFYADLETLRKIRNRIHIQNDKQYSPQHEMIAFQDNEKILAEKALEVVLRTMRKKYSRPPSVQGYVRDFIIPWGARYEGIDTATNT